jgi:hypothetical protein
MTLSLSIRCVASARPCARTGELQAESNLHGTLLARPSALDVEIGGQ